LRTQKNPKSLATSGILINMIQRLLPAFLYLHCNERGEKKQMKFKTFELVGFRHGKIIVLYFNKKRNGMASSNLLYVNKEKPILTLKISKKIADNYRMKQQAKRDGMTSCGKPAADALFTNAFLTAKNRRANGSESYFIAHELYWSGYARGVRENRQAQKNRREAQSNVGALTGNDIAELAQALHVDINAVNSAVLEVAARKAVQDEFTI
jgi:hypothetical protein